MKLSRLSAKKKRKRTRHYDLQIYFVFAALVIIALTVTISGVLALIAERILSFQLMIEIPSLTLPLISWTLLFVLLITTFYTTFLTRQFFDPIRRLSDKMEQVAKGDFKVTVGTTSRINEIRDCYRNFNRMARELDSTEILQTDFVSNVSHEFKTPLAAIDGYATILQDKSLTEEEKDKYLQMIIYNTRRLNDLISNILLLSKVENKVIQPVSTVYRLDEQIRQALFHFEAKWEEKNLDFDVDLASVDYLGNEALMFHVFTNLIGNAVKFSPVGGVITLRLTHDADGICFEISDRGPGITPGSESHLFEKFYQNDSSHKAEGNGLGLALVKRILDLSGGIISVENLPECGCKFTVLLPQ